MFSGWSCIISLVAVFLVLPLFWNIRLLRLYRRQSHNAAPAGTLPRAAILLPLRGADPSLEPCLAGLLQQDYPDYCIHLVIDSPQDPAWGVVEALLARCGKRRARDVRVEVLESPLPTCSLKVSAQLQAIGRLDPDVGVVAMIDADSIPGPGWLRAMVQPLLQPGVGASTGIRWYAPPDDGWGTLVRYIYNTASIPQMYAFDLPWGGALAFRADVLRHSRLPRHWTHCFCEDESCGDVLRELGLRLAFVTEATHVNHEYITMPQCESFLLRQLLCLRLHHRNWPLILTSNVAIILAQFAAPLLLGAALVAQAWSAAAALAALFVLHVMAISISWHHAEEAVRRVVAGRGEARPPGLNSRRLFPAILLTQILTLRAFFQAQFSHQVDWRGVSYRIEGKDQIRLIEYRPYTLAGRFAESNLSVV